MLALGALWGKRKKYFGVQTRPGGWGGSSDHQNKTAPEPPAAPEPLVLQNKTAPEPPLPYFGGSTSKKTAPEPPLPILLTGHGLLIVFPICEGGNVGG